MNLRKRIIITGASTGIGKATSLKFLKEGWSVGLLSRNEYKLSEIAAGRENAIILPCDVTKQDEVEIAFKTAIDNWGHIDVLFNNAGVGLKSVSIEDITFDQWKNVFEVNVNGSFLCSKLAFSYMKQQDPQGGRIINNGSISAQTPRPGSAAYSASKHAITGLTKSLSLDGRKFNIACGQIDIGNALTDMSKTQRTGVPQADGTIKKEPMFDVEHVATSVFHMACLPLDANVQSMTLMASNMPFIGRG
jgi:NAD(P)-dependent dehydrogenase (short-subunit alcohol dehydrogenase family)